MEIQILLSISSAHFPALNTISLFYTAQYFTVLHITAKHLRVGFISNDRHPFQFFFSYTRSMRIMLESRCPVLPNCHYSR